MPAVQVFPTAAALAEAAARQVVIAARQAQAQRGAFHCALSGGSTPEHLYRLLAQPEWANQIDWARTHVYWGDERCVPPQHPDSNYRMAQAALLAHVPLPAENIQRIPGELPPPRAAAVYAQTLAAALPEQRFDLLLLGMGADGHTASVFPGTIAEAERHRDCVAVYVPHLNSWRVTLTLPVINLARRVLFLVSGADKAAALHRVLHASPDAPRLPAGLVEPASGDLLWLVEAAAYPAES